MVSTCVVDGVTGIIFYLLTDILDVTHNDVAITNTKLLPDHIIDLFFAEYSAWISGEQMQDFKFNKSKFYAFFFMVTLLSQLSIISF